MKISNFKLVAVRGNSPLTYRFKATVDITTRGFPFLKKTTETKEVFKGWVGQWRFVDTGEVTPWSHVANLAAALVGQKGKDLQYCLDDSARGW